MALAPSLEHSTPPHPDLKHTPTLLDTPSLWNTHFRILEETGPCKSPRFKTYAHLAGYALTLEHSTPPHPDLKHTPTLPDTPSLYTLPHMLAPLWRCRHFGYVPHPTPSLTAAPATPSLLCVISFPGHDFLH